MGRLPSNMAASRNDDITMSYSTATPAGCRPTPSPPANCRPPPRVCRPSGETSILGYIFSDVDGGGGRLEAVAAVSGGSEGDGSQRW